MHRDSRNAAHPNLLLALSSFTGGQVWCESPEGTVSRIVQGVPTLGVLLEVADSPQVLDAHRCFHCTEPWEGTRVVLIGFSVDVSGLPTPDVQLLLHLGFVLVPAPSEGDRLDPNHDFPPLPPCGFVDPDLPRPVLAAGDRLDPNPAFPPLPPSGCIDPDLPRHVHAAQLEVLAQGPSSAASPSHQVPLSPAQAHMAQAPTSDSVDPREVRVISSEEESSGDEAFDPFTSRCSGPPIKSRHGAGDRELVDGFGLCSPGRWRPLQRGRLCTGTELDHARSVQEALCGFVLSEAAFALASGHLKASPFSDAGLGRLRKSLAALLPDPELALEHTPGQPFWLHLLHQSLVILGDPDAAILVDGDCSFAEGVHLGDECPIARAPQVYRKRVNFRALDVTEFEPDMANYSSAELSADQLEEQFRRDERAGLMMPTTEAAVEAEFGPGRLLVAALGAVAKPNGEVRPLHDATHGIGLNNKIRVLDKLEVPGPDELLEVTALGRESREAVFAICGHLPGAPARESAQG